MYAVWLPVISAGHRSRFALLVAAVGLLGAGCSASSVPQSSDEAPATASKRPGDSSEPEDSAEPDDPSEADEPGGPSTQDASSEPGPSEPDASTEPETASDPDRAEQMIGPEGGMLAIDDVASVEVPVEALDHEEMLRATVIEADALPVAALAGLQDGEAIQGHDLLASASVASNNTWAYKDITAVNVSAGTQYTVAVYLAGSGGTQRTSIASLPRTYGNVRIDAATQVSTLLSPSAVPTTNFTPNTTMLGQPDIKFIKN